jgi:hypothetical protein
VFCQAIEYFVKLLHDLDIICSYSLDPSLEGVLQFVVQFQKSRPDLVARAHLQVDFYCIHFLFNFYDLMTAFFFFVFCILLMKIVAIDCHCDYY